MLLEGEHKGIPLVIIPTPVVSHEHPQSSIFVLGQALGGSWQGDQSDSRISDCALFLGAEFRRKDVRAALAELTS